jgi:hypothetical protein
MLCLLMILSTTFMSDPIRTFGLESKDIVDMARRNVKLAADGTILAMDAQQVWHWTQDGALISHFGRQGQGPGEFSYISDVLWTGEYYWVTDAGTRSSSIFDRKGQFRHRTDVHYRQFLQTDGELLVVDMMGLSIDPPNYPPVIKAVEYRIEDGVLIVENERQPFKKMTRLQGEYQHSFKLHWAAREGDTYFVVDQLEPKIWIYDDAAIAREKKTDFGEPVEVFSMPLALKYWVDVPDNSEFKRRPIRQSMIWWSSWSRINYFGMHNGRFVVAYEVPNSEESTSSLQIVQVLDREGRHVGEPLVIEYGSFLGILDDQVLVVSEKDDLVDEDYEFVVDVYAL